MKIADGEMYEVDSKAEHQKSAIMEDKKNIKFYTIIIVISLIAGFLGGISCYKFLLSDFHNSMKKIEKEATNALKEAEKAQKLALSGMSTTRGSDAVIGLTEPGGYTFINNKHGVFYLTLKDVTDYANGYKLILNIGNPSNAIYSGFELTAKWPPFAHLNKEGEKTKTESYIQELRPGAWNKVEFILPSKDIDAVVFSLKTDRVTLQ